MPSCRDISKLIASGEHTALPWHRRLALKLHLAMCRHCRRYAAQLRAIGDAARDLLHTHPEDPETLDHLERAILDKHPDQSE